ncbi:MAG TPA: M14 family metallopeptidase, partial [Phycisphaerae bacterium]|nr:M14 family metallopeptidase [Phycisphaerae bacterium]
MRVLSCIISCLLLGTTATAWAAGTQDALPPLSEARDDLRIVRISLADLQGQPADVRAWIDEHLDPCAIDRDPDGIRRAVLFLTPDELAALQARGAPVEDVGRLADHIAAFAPWNTLAKKRVPSIEAVVGRIMPETEGPDDDGAPRGVECQNIGTSLMPYDEYHNIEESVCFLQNLAAAYPNICRLVSLGQSIQGRDIWALKITDQPDAVEPGEEKIFIKATTHAREWATHETLLYIAEYLTSRYATDARVQRIVDRSVVWLVPITNPDGYAHTWNGPQPSARMWRKNRKLNNVQNCNNNPNSTCCGVDINRNYSYVWGNFGGSSGNACSETYRGGSAASEPETQAIQNFIAAEKPAIAVSFHSYSQLWLYPWGNTGSVTPESYSSLRAMGKKLSQLVNDVHGLFYIPGQSNYNIYATNGDFNDFAYGAHGVLSFTPEVRPTNTGLGGFLLPEDQILECAEENTAAMLWLMDNVAGTIDVRSSADGSLFETVAADETLEFALPGPPAHQRPTDSLGYPAGFPNTLLTRLDDNVHNPPSWGDFPADFEGCGTGSGYTLETRDQP